MKKEKRGNRGFLDFVDRLTLDSVLHAMLRYHQTTPYWITAILGVLLSSICSIVFDMFVPMHGGVLGFVRAVFAIIIACFYFMLGYSLAIYQSDSRRIHYDDDAPIDQPVPDYVTFRQKYSYRQRRRQSYPAIAVVLVIIISSVSTHLYTLFAGMALAMVMAIVAYIRPTNAETILLMNNKPDPRDIIDIAQTVQDNEQKEAEKRKKRRKSKESDDSGDYKPLQFPK